MKKWKLIEDHETARCLTDPIRQKILQLAVQPISASEVAAKLERSRQSINYHFQKLIQLGLLIPHDTQTKRNMLSVRYMAKARSYIIDPRIFADLHKDTASDQISLGTLISLGASIQKDCARLYVQSEKKDIPSLSLRSVIRFRSPSARKGFQAELQELLHSLIEKYSAPDGQPYKLFAGTYPEPLKKG